MVGDDGQGLERGLGQAPRLLAFHRHQESQIGCGLEAPAPSDLGQLNSSALIAVLQGIDGAQHVGVGRQPVGQILDAQGLGCGE